MMAAAVDSVVRPATAIEYGRLGGLAVLNLATTGYADIKEFQKAQVMVAPAIQTEGKALQQSQRVGMA